MEQTYLIDTNVIIDNFGNKLPEKAKQFLNTFQPIVSAVTKIELLGWLNATKEQLNPIYSFTEIAFILPINEDVIEKTIQIRQTNKIALGDAIIAATAIMYHHTLITRNVRDFQNIAELKTIDPYSL